MEQIQIRQPKMPVAQSFIQKLETFLATGFYSLVLDCSNHIKRLEYDSPVKALAISEFMHLKSHFFLIKNKFINLITLRISTIYYFLLIFIYIFFSEHEKVKFVF